MQSSLVSLGLDLASPVSGVYAADWVAAPSGGEIVSIDPSTGQRLGAVLTASAADYERVMVAAAEAHEAWRRVPAPVRGDLVRLIGNALRQCSQVRHDGFRRQRSEILGQ